MLEDVVHKTVLQKNFTRLLYTMGLKNHIREKFMLRKDRDTEQPLIPKWELEKKSIDFFQSIGDIFFMGYEQILWNYLQDYKLKM